MSTIIPFRRRALATCVAATCGSLPLAGHAAANAGKIDFAIGNVTATTGSGEQRALRKGAKIGVGDTIETNRGRAWLRFRDGGYMSLQPGTEFRVDEYQFEGEEDGNEKSFFSLLRGGVRAITGLVGKTNRNNYRLKTPIATIGIRGTEYLAQLGNSLTVACGVGICAVTNAAGETLLQAGETLYLEDENSTGERVFRRKMNLTPAEPTVLAAGEYRESDGSLSVVEIVEDVQTPIVVPPEVVFSDDVPLHPGDNTGTFVVFSYAGDGGEFIGDEHGVFLAKGTAPDHVTANLAELDDSLALQRAHWNEGSENVVFDHDGGEFCCNNPILQEFDTDGVIAWGRWGGMEGFVEGTIFENPDRLWVNDYGQDVHYLGGVPTPETDLMNLASLGSAAVYNLIGATMPTFGNDSFEGEIDFGNIVAIRGALAANFAEGTVDTSLVLDFDREDLTINSGAMPIGAGPGGSFAANGGLATSTLEPGKTYEGWIRGAFFGGGASRAGYGYDIYIVNPSEDSYTIQGVAAFRKGGTATPIMFNYPELN